LKLGSVGPVYIKNSYRRSTVSLSSFLIWTEGGNQLDSCLGHLKEQVVLYVNKNEHAQKIQHVHRTIKKVSGRDTWKYPITSFRILVT
jgi:hypothetical protein